MSPNPFDRDKVTTQFKDGKRVVFSHSFDYNDFDQMLDLIHKAMDYLEGDDEAFTE